MARAETTNYKFTCAQSASRLAVTMAGVRSRTTLVGGRERGRSTQPNLSQDGMARFPQPLAARQVTTKQKLPSPLNENSYVAKRWVLFAEATTCSGPKSREVWFQMSAASSKPATNIACSGWSVHPAPCLHHLNAGEWFVWFKAE